MAPSGSPALWDVLTVLMDELEMIPFAFSSMCHRIRDGLRLNSKLLRCLFLTSKNYLFSILCQSYRLALRFAYPFSSRSITAVV